MNLRPGFPLLAGIIVNNAILLLDRVKTERKNGLAPDAALIAASLKRFRPILLMAFTAIIGLLPLAVMGGDLWQPMANVMIFGLLTATVLGLIFTPTLHALFFGISFRSFVWDPAVLDTPESDGLLFRACPQSQGEKSCKSDRNFRVFANE